MAVQSSSKSIFVPSTRTQASAAFQRQSVYTLLRSTTPFLWAHALPWRRQRFASSLHPGPNRTSVALECMVRSAYIAARSGRETASLRHFFRALQQACRHCWCSICMNRSCPSFRSRSPCPASAPRRRLRGLRERGAASAPARPRSSVSCRKSVIVSFSPSTNRQSLIHLDNHERPIAASISLGPFVRIAHP